MANQAQGRLKRVAVVFLAAVLGVPAHAQQTVPAQAPGYRPEATEAATFIASLEDAVVAVLPTVVRSPEGSEFAYASQELIAELINEAGLATAIVAEAEVDPGSAPHRSQWDLFQGSMETLASAMAGREVGCDYVLLLEVVLPPGPPQVFGVHMYILDQNGRNAFSFLLNSHHQAFREAQLFADDRSDEAMADLVARATRLGVATLAAQVEFATACEVWMAAHPAVEGTAGVFQDFEAGLPAVQDEYEVPLGFSTFANEGSRAELGVTTFHPARSGEATGNHTLKLDMDLSGWAGFAYLFHDVDPVAWVPQDWTRFEGLSFWMYGSNTGVDFFVDVLDNRNPCSTYYDDAERYTWGFVDNFAGWRQIVVPFEELARKEIHNGAPNDGLGLDRVHGWAIGATDGRAGGTWYIDAVALWSHEAATVATR